jgi:dCMP deaminase
MTVPATFDVILLRAAVEMAKTASNDPHTQNGAILLAFEADRAVTVGAANSLPPGVASVADRFERPLKYSFVEHAERGAIYAAARAGLKTAGATLYCPWFACADCARAIICAGITTVVGHVVPRQVTPERWQEPIRIADQMLAEAGVTIRLSDQPLGVRYLFNGEQLEL